NCRDHPAEPEQPGQAQIEGHVEDYPGPHRLPLELLPPVLRAALHQNPRDIVPQQHPGLIEADSHIFEIPPVTDGELPGGAAVGLQAQALVLLELVGEFCEIDHSKAPERNQSMRKMGTVVPTIRPRMNISICQPSSASV